MLILFLAGTDHLEFLNSSINQSINPPPGKRVQTVNAPRSETGPGTVATSGKAITDEVDAMGFKWE
jgi:hypothetical protein